MEQEVRYVPKYIYILRVFIMTWEKSISFAREAGVYSCYRLCYQFSSAQKWIV